MTRRLRAAWRAYKWQAAEHWYVVQDFGPLGDRIVYASRRLAKAEAYLDQVRDDQRYKIVDADTWAWGVIALMRSDAPWQALADLAADATRWHTAMAQQHAEEFVMLTRREATWTSGIKVTGPSVVDDRLTRALRRSARLLGNVGRE